MKLHNSIYNFKNMLILSLKNILTPKNKNYVLLWSLEHVKLMPIKIYKIVQFD
jgi:hypothetical protein